MSVTSGPHHRVEGIRQGVPEKVLLNGLLPIMGSVFAQARATVPRRVVTQGFELRQIVDEVQPQDLIARHGAGEPVELHQAGAGRRGGVKISGDGPPAHVKFQ